MEVRYFLEMFVFFVLICAIQYNFIRFVKLYNSVLQAYNANQEDFADLEAGEITFEEYIPRVIAFHEMYLYTFDDTATSLVTCFQLSLCLLIWPCRVILFSIHNYLTGRAYSYSLDDLCDFIIALVIFVWSSSYIIWSKSEFENMTEEQIQNDYPHV